MFLLRKIGIINYMRWCKPAVLKMVKMSSCFTSEKKVMHIVWNVKLLMQGQKINKMCSSVSGEENCSFYEIGQDIYCCASVYIHTHRKLQLLKSN